jgi:transcriptional regulator with XRE-family HTH domain
MDDQQIYEKLRSFRRARGISVDELAKEMGENSQKVSRIERGERSLTVDYLLKVSKALSTPIEALLLEEKDEEPPAPSFDSDVLNGVIVFIEEIIPKLPTEYSSQRKAKMISKLYELVLKVSPENQSRFLHFLRESLQIILQKESG